MLASVTIFATRIRTGWWVLATTIAAAVEVTALTNRDPLDITVSSGRVFVIDFGHYYAMLVLPFAILAAVASLLSLMEPRTAADN